ncbi:flagellin FliC [Salmonella enterica subsp. enterica serovar Senftenberg]|nr:flagellin FliC [Salmonella enterica subsp. enterica serovar Senftenberg]
MAQVINTNSLSLLTQNNLNKSQSSLSSAIERLSSGLRINSAKDDAAGQAIANRFTSNIKGLTQASRNANDGISLAQTTEGALSEINNNLQRVRELSVQATNGTNSQSDLDSIQAEITQRLGEIDRVSGQTQFNGVKVLSESGELKIQVGANDNETISINLKEINSKTLGLDGFNVNSKLTKAPGTSSAINTVSPDVAIDTAQLEADVNSIETGKAVLDGVGVRKADDGNYYVKVKNTSTGAKDGYYKATVNETSGVVTINTAGGVVKTAPTFGAPAGTGSDALITSIKNTAINTKVTIDAASTTGIANAKLVTLQDSEGNNLKDAAGKDMYAIKGDDGVLYAADVNTATGGAKVIQQAYKDKEGKAQNANVTYGGTDGKTQVVTIDSKVFTKADVIANNDLRTANLTEQKVNTAKPLAQIDKALAQVDALRSDLGAVQNRFDSAISNLGNTVNNLSSARSRIEDSDYATEVSNMSRAQILQQAGTSVLAQANQTTQNVLSLLR